MVELSEGPPKMRRRVSSDSASRERSGEGGLGGGGGGGGGGSLAKEAPEERDRNGERDEATPTIVKSVMTKSESDLIKMQQQNQNERQHQSQEQIQRQGGSNNRSNVASATEERDLCRYLCVKLSWKGDFCVKVTLTIEIMFL